MSTTASQEVRQPERDAAAGQGTAAATDPAGERLGAARAPEPLPLQDLELSDGVRWVDIYGGVLGIGEVLALLAPICNGKLKQRMVRDLITPKRFAAGGGYRDSEVVITSGFRIRHLGSDANGSKATNGNGATNGPPVAAVFEPVQLLVGDDWLLSCWHPPRVFRGHGRSGSCRRRLIERPLPGCRQALADEQRDGRRGPRQARAPRARRRRRLPAADQLTPKRARPVRSAGGPHGCMRGMP